MDMTSNYMGMKLRTPLVVSACSLSEDICNIERMAHSGASAIVLYSVFEEQVRKEREQFDQYFNYGTDTFAEALSYLPEPGYFKSGLDDYLNLIRKSKKTVDIPIIGSLNGVSAGGWIDFAKQIEQAGADALELNIYFLPSDISVSGAKIEQTCLDILKAVKGSVNIPVAVKLSPFFSNTAYMAKLLEEAGANALVLFNRFYQPDVDLDILEIKPKLLLSSAQEMRLPLCWIGMLYGRIKTDFAATTGIHNAEDAIKMLMVGANVTMICSTLFRNGIEYIGTMEQDMVKWLEKRNYKSLEQMRGSMSQIKSDNPAAFERQQYMCTIKTAEPIF